MNLGERLALLGPGGLYLAAFFVVPLVLVVGYAFLTPSRFGGATWSLSFDSISRLAEPVYRRVIATSVVLALAATVIALLIGYPAALAIARLPSRWRTVALVAVVLPFWTNFLIRMYAWIVLLNNEGLINRILRGLSVTDEPIALMNNRPAIVLGLVYAYLPLMILPLYSAIERLDPQLGEAATNLGASAGTRFRTITLPLTTQGALTGAMFVFVPSLANFIVPELLGGGKTATIGTLARDQYLETRNWPFGSSITLVVLVIVGLIVAAQSRFARRYGATP